MNCNDWKVIINHLDGSKNKQGVFLLSDKKKTGLRNSRPQRANGANAW